MATGDKIVTLDDLKVAYDQNGSSISDLKSAFDTELNSIVGSAEIEFDWEQGGIDGSGAEVASVSRIRSDFVDVTNAKYLVCQISSTFRCYIAYYNSSKTFVRNQGWISGETKQLNLGAAAYIRVLFTKLTDNITPYVTSEDASANMFIKYGEISAGWLKSEIDKSMKAYGAESNNLNDFIETGSYIFAISATLTNAPTGNETSGRRYVRVYKFSAGISVQEFVNATTGKHYVRMKHDGTVWDSWVQIDDESQFLAWKQTAFNFHPYSSGDTIDDMTSPGFYIIPYSAVINSQIHSDPIGANKRRVLEVYKDLNGGVYTVQKIWQYASSNACVYMRYFTSNTWSEWMPETAESVVNHRIYNRFLPANSGRYIYAKGKMWCATWNTVEAYQLAAEDSKCWGISGDVQFTSDGKLVMYHDTAVTYNGSQVAISSLTYAQVQSIVLSPLGAKQYSIPDYGAFLDICRKSGKMCFVETKGPLSNYAWTTNNHATDFELLIDEVLSRGMQDSTVFLVSANDIAYLTLHYPKLCKMRLADGNISDAELTATINDPQRILSGYPSAWTAEKIETLHKNGRLAVAYTTRPQTKAQIEAMNSLGVDAVCVFVEPPEKPQIQNTTVLEYVNGSIASPQADNVGTRLTVMSYNVANYNNDTGTYIGDNAIIAIKKLLSKYKPHVIGLQEDREYIDSGNTKSAHTYIYTPIYPYKYGQGGVTILSKQACSNAWIVAFTDRRVMRTGIITIGNKKLLVVNAHPTPGDAEAGHASQTSINSRNAEYTELFKWIHKEITLESYNSGTVLTCPDWDWCIIVGDMNSSTATDRQNLKTLASARNFAMANGGWLGWIKTHKSGLMLDNVIVSQNVIIESVEVAEENCSELYSDHYPVISQVTLL